MTTNNKLFVGALVKYQGKRMPHSWDGSEGFVKEIRSSGVADVLFHKYSYGFLDTTEDYKNYKLSCTIDNLILVEVDVGDLEDDY